MSAGRPTTVFDALDRTPLSYAILIAYVLLAIWTDPMNPSTLMLVEHGAAAGMLVQDGEGAASGGFLGNPALRA